MVENCPGLIFFFLIYFDHLHLLAHAQLQPEHGPVPGSAVAANDRDGSHSSAHKTAAVHLHVGLHNVVYGAKASKWFWKECPNP